MRSVARNFPTCYAFAVAIRFTLNGIDYTVDTAKEAADLQTVLTRKNSAVKAAGARWAKAEPPHAPKHVQASRLIQALYDANTKLTKDGIAKALGLKVTGVPPLFNHGRKWLAFVAPTMKWEQIVSVFVNPFDGPGGTMFGLTKAGRELVERVKRDAA